MSKFLLDFAFPISLVESTPAASTAFLKQVLVIAKPNAGNTGNVGTVYECVLASEASARTDNGNCDQLFAAGMSKVYLLLSDDLDVADALESEFGKFFTILISDDFDQDDVTATAATGTATITSYANLLTTSPDSIEVAGVVFMSQAGAVTLGDATFRAATSNDATATSLAAQINGHAVVSTKVTATVLGAVVTITADATGKAANLFTLAYDDNGAEVGATVSGSGFLAGGDGLAVGDFEGVIGFSSDDQDECADFAADARRCGFFGATANGAKSMFYAFGKLLSNAANWTNLQYIPMPVDDGIDTLGEANSMYDDRVSFAINDDEFGKRLGFFVAGGKAIAAPYIEKNLRVDLQSAALTWISANQPSYTVVEASLLETRLQEDVINVMYIQPPRKWISAGVVSITLVETNFIGSADIDIAEPKALWRLAGQMTTSL